MSWWDVGGGDDVIGDAPADTLKRALNKIAKAREEQGKPAPTLQEMADSFAAALRAAWQKSVEARGRESFNKIVIKPKSAEAIESDGKTEKGDPQLVSAFRGAIEEIAKLYEKRWERKPRLRELLETLSFILSYEPERFLSGAEGAEIETIEAE